jgi:hypothetical protein
MHYLQKDYTILVFFFSALSYVKSVELNQDRNGSASAISHPDFRIYPILMITYLHMLYFPVAPTIVVASAFMRIRLLLCFYDTSTLSFCRKNHPRYHTLSG